MTGYTSIDQFLYPKLDRLSIPRLNIRRNAATSKTSPSRGDIWIATVRHDHPHYEDNIVALMECKDRSAGLGSAEWTDAMSQGKSKARAQGLNTYWVTNTDDLTQCYNSSDDSTVTLDGQPITALPNLPTLQAIQTQVNENSSEVYLQTFSTKKLDPKAFRTALWNIRQIFRSKGISKGSEDSIIKTTLTFGILKLISEQQEKNRTIPSTVLLWNDWRDGQLDREIRNTIQDIAGLQQYKHLEDCLYIDDGLDASACVKIKEELQSFELYGSDFDFFGLVYESLANKELKKDFGEFYTPRHIIRTIVRTLLGEEKTPRTLKICDPACGTGGFLVESFLFLQRQYESNSSLQESTLNELKNKTFFGLDTNDKVAIPFARTNMLMADDGGVNIKVTADSLVELPVDKYDYVLTNVPYGKYDGAAPIENFSFTNSKRYELLFLEKIIRSLKPGGRAALIVPDGLVESTSNSSFRYRVLRTADLEAVVSLPPFVFEPYTSEKTYVLYIRRKRPANEGQIQSTPTFHFIVDNDGFQEGKKRYAINDNDLPVLEKSFRQETIRGKAEFVDIARVNEDSYHSFCSEYYLRRRTAYDMPEDEFLSVLEAAEDYMTQEKANGNSS